MAEQVLTSLAILKVNWNKGKDYIENFIPFIANCLLNSKSKEISISELQNEVFNTFNIKIPQGALRTILHRCVKNNLVKIENHVYIKNEDELKKIEFKKISSDAERQESALISKLIQFAKDRFNKKWTADIAENSLFAYLKKRSMTIMSTIVDSDPLPESIEIKGDVNFIINSFIADIYKNDPAQFGYLETIVKGLMLLGVLYYPEIGQATMKFKKVKFIFDTSFLIRSLGYTNQAEHISFRELLDLLYELNAELCVFEETIEEIRGVLNSALESFSYPHQYNSTTQGEAFDFFIQSKFSRSDIELRIAKLEKDIEGLRIKTIKRPKYDEELGVDEDILHELLYKNVGYSREKPLLHDLDSITAIYRFRNGQEYYSIENCQAIFVTDNSNLALASVLFMEKLFDNKKSIPLVICDYILTTIAWLKKPLKAPELPKRKIIADCYAAMNPPNELWRNYVEEVESLKNQGNISEDDYYLLRYSTEAKKLLMENTEGGIKGFSSGTIPEILEKSKENIQAIAKKELEEERKQREISDAELFSTKQEITNICVKFGKFVRVFIKVIVIGVILYFSYVIFPRISDIRVAISPIILNLAFIVLSSLSVLGVLESKLINNLLASFEIGVSGFVKKKVFHLLKLKY